MVIFRVCAHNYVRSYSCISFFTPVSLRPGCSSILFHALSHACARSSFRRLSLLLSRRHYSVIDFSALLFSIVHVRNNNAFGIMNRILAQPEK